MANKKIVNYYFPYFRRGLGANLAIPSNRNVGKRPTMDINMVLKKIGQGSNLSENVKQTVQLYGPGDVLGFDTKKMIVRAQPSLNDGNFLPNDIPFIDFAEPDFLWRYSAKKDQKTKKNWIPWLSLIVLKMKDGEVGQEFTEGKRRAAHLPNTIELTKDAVLPNLEESWRWAHVHCTDIKGTAMSTIGQKIASQSGYAVSRLLVTRKLVAGTKYCAFVVPTYLLGWEAAMGIKNTATNRTQLSWKATDNLDGKVIPYYYRWEFRTGLKGDFEQVLRLLKPNPISNLGGKVINIDNPGYGLLNQSEILKTIEIDGALQSSDQNEEMPNPLSSKIQDLADLLNKGETPTGMGDTQLRVVPPIYGRWINNKEWDDVNLQPNQANNRWLEMLNLDVRYRIAAGLGVKYVKEHQEQLMKEAWQQLSKIQEENRRLNLERFGREISNCLYKRITNLENAGAVVELASAADTVIAPKPTTRSRKTNGRQLTLRAKLKASSLPNTLSHLKARKYYAHRKNKAFDKIDKTQHPLNNKAMNLNDISAASYPNAPISNENHYLTFIQNTGNFETYDAEKISSEVKTEIAPSKTIEQRAANRITTIRDWEIKQKYPDLFDERPRDKRKKSRSLNATDDILRPVMAFPEFHVPMYQYLLSLSEDYFVPGLDKIPNNTVSILVTNPKFIEAFMVGLNHEFAAELRWREFPTDLRGSYFRNFWDVTIYSVDDNEKLAFRNSKYGQALLKELKMDNRQWVTIEKGYYEAENPSIAKAYETAIEKWLITREEDKTIRKLSTWSKGSELGRHSVTDPSVRQDRDNEVVLLIKADLLKKFPNTFIYLAPKDGQNQPLLDDSSKPVYPIFEANLPPDIICLGFPKSEAEARNHYIIFEERGAEVRFGLDINIAAEPDGSKVENLSWEHFSGTGIEGYLDCALPNGNAAKNNWSKAAFIPTALTQKPVRMAIDLNTLLP